MCNSCASQTDTFPSFQDGVKKFGFKQSKVKATLLRQMKQCWHAMHPEDSAQNLAHETDESDDLVGVLRALSASEASSVDAPLSAKKKRTKKRAKKQTVEEVDVEVVVEPEMIFKEILTSEDIYLRLLRYEVSGAIHFICRCIRLIAWRCSHSRSTS